jgi:hypothetical protein
MLRRRIELLDFILFYPLSQSAHSECEYVYSLHPGDVNTRTCAALNGAPL